MCYMKCSPVFTSRHILKISLIFPSGRSLKKKNPKFKNLVGYDILTAFSFYSSHGKLGKLAQDFLVKRESIIK